MKPLNKLPKKRTGKLGLTKLNAFQKILIFIALIIVSFTVLPAVVVLFIGLLPTLTTVIVDTKNINKITSVGCFNIAGLMFCLKNIFEQFSSSGGFSIEANILNIIIMLFSAGAGLALYRIMPDLFVYIFKNSAQHRLKAINAKLEKLKENWANVMPEDR